MLKLVSIKSLVLILVQLSFGTVAHATDFQDLLLGPDDDIYIAQVKKCEERIKKCNAIVDMMDDFDGDTKPLRQQCTDYKTQCTWLSFTANDGGGPPYGIKTDGIKEDDPRWEKIKAAYVEYNRSDMVADGAFHTGVANECTQYDNEDDEQLVCIKNIIDVQTNMYNDAAVILQQRLTQALE